MFSDYKEGEVVMRIKTNLLHRNPAVRDWPAFRIIDKGKHPFKKARVWPLLNFASAIDDYEFKITHIVRGIDLRISDERQGYIYKYFGWKYPETIYTGRLFFQGLKSTSEIKKLIKEGKLTGWNDLSLGTIRTLRRRGFKAEAIKRKINVGTALTLAIENWLSSLKKTKKSLLDWKPTNYGSGTEKLSEEVDEVLYGDA